MQRRAGCFWQTLLNLCGHCNSKAALLDVSFQFWLKRTGHLSMTEILVRSWGCFHFSHTSL